MPVATAALVLVSSTSTILDDSQTGDERRRHRLTALALIRMLTAATCDKVEAKKDEADHMSLSGIACSFAWMMFMQR